MVAPHHAKLRQEGLASVHPHVPLLVVGREHHTVAVLEYGQERIVFVPVPDLPLPLCKLAPLGHGFVSFGSTSRLLDRLYLFIGVIPRCLVLRRPVAVCDLCKVSH